MTNTTLADRLAAARRTLEAVGQQHVLTFLDQLNDAQTKQLLEQIESIDWPEIARLVDSHVKQKPEFALPDNVAPAPWYPYEPAADQKAKYVEARKLGEQLLRDGKVAAFTVAGGQGTRLGWDGPKGTYPATPVRGLSLFGCFAEYIRKLEEVYNTTVPWYIMTSHTNDAETRQYFNDEKYFGLKPANVMMFPQAMLPAVETATGKVLLGEKDSLALSPNGHGGSLKALYTSGAIADMLQRGIEQISYTQVDNPIVRVVDPLFLGLHAIDGAQMSSKMLPKAYPKEKLGNFCLVDGRMTVIEYSDLPDALAEERVANGDLRFRAGSIAIHTIRADFVKAINEQAGGFGLPFHRADKKVPYVDLKTGQAVEPKANNAVKFEMFVFDALPLCDTSIIYETSRPDEFAPIKNADAEGALDCPATSKRTQIERAGRWLEEAGLTVPRDKDGNVDAVIEIKQTTAIYAEHLQGVDLPASIDRGQELAI